MRSSRKRSEAVRLFGRRSMMLGLFILVLGAGGSVWSVYNKSRDSAILKQEAQAQLQDLSKRKEELTAVIGKLHTDRGVEEALRQQYALAAEGEGVVVIVDDAPTSTPQQATSTRQSNWFENIFGWL